MLLTPDQIQSEALSLPAQQRSQLAERLLASLDDEVNEGAEQEWLAVAKRRLDEIRSGAVAPIPGDEALARLRAAVTK